MHSIDFHAHHSPQCAYATFTCGRHRAGGGLSIEGMRPPKDDLFIGFEEDGLVHALPFWAGATAALDTHFDELKVDRNTVRRPMVEGLKRVYRRSTDTWQHGPFTFTIHTPVSDLPDPGFAGEGALNERLLPAIVVTLRLDNRGSAKRRTLLFAHAPGAPCYHVEGITGGAAVGWGREFAIGCAHPRAQVFTAMNEGTWLAQRLQFTLGFTCGATLDVEPGEVAEFDLVLCFHRAGSVTTGIDARFWYTRAYPTLASVVNAALPRIQALRSRAAANDADLAASGLDAHQQFLSAHAERSYWGNTQLLDHGGKPLYVVLEGEYAMINTFDLTVDMCFYEMRRHPWTVRNVLDQFADRYSFVDTLAEPSGALRRSEAVTCDPRRVFEVLPEPARTGLPGGISFCHDMGVAGHFTPQGTSSYEMPRMSGCFSHMTAEQLLNWICTATTYLAGTNDAAWRQRRAVIFAACLESLEHRDHPEPGKRTGIINLDSDRCAGGWEITTYDSLDPSLGQSRANLYMATKGWAAWHGLAQVFTALGDRPRAERALAGAALAMRTIAARFDAALGYIPAIFDGRSRSAIIPAIEGLVFPLVWGRRDLLDRHGASKPLLDALDRHLRAILKPGVCIYPDGGWKLSSTADNSWISKIFIAQVVAERVFGITPAPESHAAHARWMQVGSADFAMCDQITAGIAKGSRYYPRCVTADLWQSTR